MVETYTKQEYDSMRALVSAKNVIIDELNETIKQLTEPAIDILDGHQRINSLRALVSAKNAIIDELNGTIKQLNESAITRAFSEAERDVLLKAINNKHHENDQCPYVQSVRKKLEDSFNLTFENAIRCIDSALLNSLAARLESKDVREKLHAGMVMKSWNLIREAMIYSGSGGIGHQYVSSDSTDELLKSNETIKQMNKSRRL